jgi:hypothetical protein
MNFPTVGDVIAAFFSASPQAGDPGVCVDARDRIEPDPEPEPEPEAEL